MMIPDHYEINVARREYNPFNDEERYVHFCRIEIKETYPETLIEKKWDIITKAFPMPDYKCTLTKVECRGRVEKEN